MLQQVASRFASFKLIIQAYIALKNPASAALCTTALETPISEFWAKDRILIWKMFKGHGKNSRRVLEDTKASETLKSSSWVCVVL